MHSPETHQTGNAPNGAHYFKDHSDKITEQLRRCVGWVRRLTNASTLTFVIYRLGTERSPTELITETRRPGVIAPFVVIGLGACRGLKHHLLLTLGTPWPPCPLAPNDTSPPVPHNCTKTGSCTVRRLPCLHEKKGCARPTDHSSARILLGRVSDATALWRTISRRGVSTTST